MNDSTPLRVVEQLIARLDGQAVDHPHFVGAPLDVSGFDALALGCVWPAARRVEHGLLAYHDPYGDPRAECLRWLHAQIDALGLAPLLDENAALELFRDIPAGEWTRALNDLPYLAGPPSGALRAELDRILSGEPDKDGGHSVSAYGEYALEYFAGRRGRTPRRVQLAERYRESPHRLREFDVLDELGPAALLALAATNDGYFTPKRLWPERDDPAVVLADEAAYVEFARETLDQATRHVANIGNGTVPYAADRAFTTDDAQVVARAVRVAAYRDEPWLRALIGPLLTGVCVAPTAAKTAPSQSLAIALGHAIETIPTPESVRALRDALTLVRHAGVQKKLQRNLKPAERALGERPRTALRMTFDAKPDKKQLPMLASCMEAGYWQDTAFDYAEWRQRLIDAPASAAFSTRMIWHARATDGADCAFLPEIANGRLVLRDAGDRVRTIDEGSAVKLWHPLLADAAERLAWQRAVIARKLRQPLRQAFREHYAPAPEDETASDSPMFEGHVLSINPLLGVARREGWSIDNYERGLMREFGDVRATFYVDAALFPGAGGHGTSGRLRFERRCGKRWEPVPPSTLNPIVFSEAVRAVDLLVSVAAFALDGDDVHDAAADAPRAAAGRASNAQIARRDRLHRLSDLPLGTMAQHRRQVLALLFAGPIERGELALEARHVRIGEYAVHCATGRVTRNGEAVEAALDSPAPPLRALPWVPYDEALLQRIVQVVAGLRP